MTAAEIRLLQNCLKHLDELGQVVGGNLHEVHKDLEDLIPEEATPAAVAKLCMTDEQKYDLAVNSLSPEERERCREIYDRYDEDGSGSVETLELRKLLEEVHGHAVPDEEFTQIMWDYDTNRDGKLQFDEFLVCFAFTETQKKAYFEQKMREDLNNSDALLGFEQEREQHARIDGVPMNTLTKYLRKELNETAACWQLPQALFTFVFFACSVTLHFQFDVLHAVDYAITWDIEENANFAFAGKVPFENPRMGFKSVYDVNSIPDFWSWFNQGLTPIFWPQSWDVSETRSSVASRCAGPRDALASYGGWSEAALAGTPLVSSDTFVGDACPEQDGVVWPPHVKRFFGDAQGVDGNYLLYHSIVAGVRLRQERYDAAACNTADDEIRKHVHVGKCKPDMLHYWLIPELIRAKRMSARHVNRPGGEDVFLLSRWSQSLVREHARGLENRLWFSPETAKVEITFTTYNAHLDLVTATYVFFFLNTGGHIHKKIEPVSFFLRPYSKWWRYIFDVAWLALVLKLAMEEGWELIKHWGQRGFIDGTKEYMTFVNFVDWIGIVYSFVLVGLWIIQLLRLSDLEATMKKGEPLQMGTFHNDAIRQEFFDQVEDVVLQRLIFGVLLAVYPFVIVSRFFKAFASQPRLALVTSTMVQASIDIFHFLVVFSVVFIVFTLMAMLLFGQEQGDFANFARATNTVFRIMLGDFDWQQLHKAGRPQAYAWFWCFQWLVNLIMLNMLLAIVMDVYTDVKSKIGKAETLWSQTLEMYRRFHEVLRGNAMPLGRVLQLLDPKDMCHEDGEGAEEETPVRVESLVSEYGISEQQALHILLEALKSHEMDKQSEDHLRDIKRIRRIETKVVQMHRSMDALRRERGASREVPQDAGNVVL